MKTTADVATALAEFAGREGMLGSNMGAFYAHHPGARAIVEWNFGKTGILRKLVEAHPDLLEYKKVGPTEVFAIFATKKANERASRTKGKIDNKLAEARANYTTGTIDNKLAEAATNTKKGSGDYLDDATSLGDAMTRLCFPPIDHVGSIANAMASRSTLINEAQRSAVGDNALLGQKLLGPRALRKEETSVTEAATVVFDLLDPFEETSVMDTAPVFVNLSDPFCMVTVGVQGSGKSHTVATLVESCVIECGPGPTARPVYSRKAPMSVVALHFGRNKDDACELVGLVQPSATLAKWSGAPHCSDMIVLVSPSFYQQRRAYYGERATVRPMLFRWETLTAAQLRLLMRLDMEDSQQLYVSVALDLLRRYQRKESFPTFEDFVEELQSECTMSGQSAPLRQRLKLLEAYVAGARDNVSFQDKHDDLADLIAPGRLIVCDLTDPLMSPADANAVFSVVLEQFRASQKDIPKLCVLDEAHRYLNGSTPLAQVVVDAARLMRHDGVRLLISTQSPLTLPPELLELSSLAILHGFQSRDWYDALAKKLTLPVNGFDSITRLLPGEALVVAPRSTILHDDDGLYLKIRPRITADLGDTRRATGIGERVTSNSCVKDAGEETNKNETEPIETTGGSIFDAFLTIA